MEDKVSTIDLEAIGIVVIGRNEGARLIRALAAAKSECNHVVYVDSMSTDGSVEAARELGVTVVPLNSDCHFTAARGRRAGFEQLLREHHDCRYVQFIDGDCILQPGWLSVAAEFLTNNPQAAVVCGRRFEADPSASFYNRLIDEEWATPVGQAAACGGDSMMRVEALRAVGSFRADLKAGEEPELCSRIRATGCEVWRIDAPMTEHDAAITRFVQWWRRAERGGFGYAQVWSATRSTPFPLYGRQMASALLWVLVVPAIVLASAAALGNWWLLMLLPAVYGLQILRIARRRDRRFSFGHRLKASAMIMLVKSAETSGVLRYWFGHGGAVSSSYKDLPPPGPSQAGSIG